MQLAKFVKFREEKFGGVLFETRSEKVFTLNPTAAAVVREIAGRARAERGDRRAPGRALRRTATGRSSAKSRAFLAELRANAAWSKGEPD